MTTALDNYRPRTVRAWGVVAGGVAVSGLVLAYTIAMTMDLATSPETRCIFWDYANSKSVTTPICTTTEADYVGGLTATLTAALPLVLLVALLVAVVYGVIRFVARDSAPQQYSSPAQYREAEPTAPEPSHFTNPYLT